MRIVRRIKDLVRLFQGRIYQFFSKYQIMDTKSTLEYIIEQNCSISRYGDGEFGLAFRGDELGFQKKDQQLIARLADILIAPPIPIF